MYECLFGALRELKDSGPLGFEGLVKALLDGFAPDLAIAFLAKSGWQAGVDASSAGFASAWVGLECKHYAPGTCPGTRDLTGGLNNALSVARESLDAWLLATTGAIDSNSATELRLLAGRSDIDVVILDWQAAGLPRLAVLCAADPKLTVDELAVRVSGLDKSAVSRDIAEIQAHPGFATAAAALREQLAAPTLGLGAARMRSAEWIDAGLRSQKEARATWQQPLSPTDSAYANLVDRPEPRGRLEEWWRNWRTKPGIALLHGREGVGKSWAALDWWNRLGDRPLTLLITSNLSITSGDPLDMLSEALDRQLREREPRFWRRRLERWLNRPPADTPSILVIFDGLNERAREDWAGRLAAFSSGTLNGHVAVLATCWTTYWQDRLKGSLSLGDDLAVTEIEVSPYDDPALAQALRPVNVTVSVLNPRTRELLRVPRVCHLAVTRFAHLIVTGDLTVECMLISDWSHRRSVKSGIKHNDREFNQLVIDAAREFRDGMTAFERERIRHYSRLARRDPHQDLTRDFDEIIGGDLFAPDDIDADTWRINPEHVGLAVGMLLADDVRRAEKQGGEAMESTVATAMEPFADFSLASAVYRGAVAAACVTPGYPSAALRVLLRGWLALRNRPKDHHDDFQAYLRDRPEVFAEVVEEVWSDQERYVDGREWLRQAFLHHADDDTVFAVFRQRAGRWLGYWSRLGHPVFAARDDDKNLKKIAERLDAATVCETEALAKLQEAVNPEGVWLTDFGLTILSLRPDVSMVDDIARWALSRAVMGYASECDDVAWLMRRAKVETTTLEIAVFAWVDRFIAMGGALSQSAAWNLLYVCGTQGAYARFDEVGGPPRRQYWVRDRFPQALEPGSAPPDMTEARETLGKLDPGIVHGHRGQTEEDMRLEDLEKGFAAYAPHELAEFVRRMLLTAPTRDYMPLRQLSWRAPQHGLLVGTDEVSALNEARIKALAYRSLEEKRDWELIELHCVLACFPALAPSERLLLLAERPSEARLSTDFEQLFGELPSDECLAVLTGLSLSDDVGRVRATLWFLSKQRFFLNDAARAVLVVLFGHDDAIVRLLAFKVATATRDDAILDYHRASGWHSRDVEDRSRENFYGSLALGSGTGPIRYDELRGRVTPELLGWVAERDGRDEAFQAFANDLDIIWRHVAHIDDVEPSITVAVTIGRFEGSQPEGYSISANEIPPINRRLAAKKPEDWVTAFREATNAETFDRRLQETEQRLEETLRAARAAGKTLFPLVMRRHGLERALTCRPDLIDRWLAALEEDNGDYILHWAGEFYRAIVIHLLRTDPDRGARLLGRLRAMRGHSVVEFTPLHICGITYAAFENGIPDSRALRELREQMLDDATTDEALFVLALVAQDTDNTGWLADVIARDAASSIQWFEARALTLIGWLDEGPTLDRFRPLLDGHDGFLGAVATTAMDRLSRNWRGRHWFNEFLVRRDPVTAWAALRLFLRCVDRRFYLWRWPAIDSVADLPRRWRETLVQNRNAIEQAVKDNEKKPNSLDDVLFGEKTTKDKLAPWI